MSPKKTKADAVEGDASAALDRLSALPDELLHKVMSFLRAWEVARTCVLACRWRNLWASAPCIDLHELLHKVILNRELEMCPIFSNLKALSLGEWCMAADFHPLVLFLQHAPNLESLFLKLKMDHEEIDDDIKLEGRSFACKNLTIVKIKCPKDDERVPVLTQFFVANGIAIEKISVYRRPTHQPCLFLAIRR